MKFLFVWRFPWMKKCHSCKYWGDLQFKDENHFVFILICIMQIDQLVMMKMVHNINFFPNQGLLHGMRNRDKFCSKNVPSFNFPTSVDNSKSSSANLFQNIIVVIYTLLCLYVHRLRNVFRIYIKHKLIIILDLAFLATNFLSGIRIDWNYMECENSV